MSSIILILFVGVFLFILGVVIFIVTSVKPKTKKCPGCKNDIRKNLNSCPYCGYILK